MRLNAFTIVPATLLLMGCISSREEPPDSSEADVSRGKLVYSQQCQACHAIHGIGGVAGPELVGAFNLIDYWEPDRFKAYVRDPSTFRSDSKMPAMPNIADRELDELMLYLRGLKKPYR